MAQLIKSIKPENDTDFKLEQLYEAIGCTLIELVYLNDGQLMIVDEEGLNTNQPLNPIASRIAGFPIVGNVVICDRSQLK